MNCDQFEVALRLVETCSKLDVTSSTLVDCFTYYVDISSSVSGTSNNDCYMFQILMSTQLGHICTTYHRRILKLELVCEDHQECLFPKTALITGWTRFAAPLSQDMQRQVGELHTLAR